MENWSKNVDFSELASRFGTPFYIFQPSQLAENINDWKIFVEYAKNIAFPVKANPAMSVIRRLVAEGTSFDCASAAEVNQVLSAGAAYESIFYNSPILDYGLAEIILKNAGSVVFNDIEQMMNLHEFILEGQHSVFIRLNPGLSSVLLEKNRLSALTAHGQKNSQFGCSEDDILALSPDLLEKIKGIHLHIGSRVADISQFELAIRKLHDISDAIEKITGVSVNQLNIGGGLGLPMNHTESYPAIKELATTLKTISRNRYRYIVEPGNSLIGNAMGLLTTIRHIKQKNKTIAILDAGSNQLLKYTLFGIQPTILDHHHRKLPHDGPDSIAGPLCFAGDVILAKTQADTLELGQPLFIQHCGAYCSALSHHFNGRFHPTVVTLTTKGQAFISDVQEDHWLYSPEMTTLRSTQDRDEFYSPVTLDATLDLAETIDLISIRTSAPFSLTFLLRLKASLNAAERSKLLFSLTREAIALWFPDRPFIDLDGLVLLPASAPYFISPGEISLTLITGGITLAGINLTFSHKHNLIGFARAV